MDEGSYPKLIAAVILLTAIGMAALYGISTLSQEIEGEHSATIVVACTSDHVWFTVDATLEVSGVDPISFSLESEETIQKTVTVHWKGSHTAEINLTMNTSGGGLGDQSDTEILIVEPDGTYNVSLKA